jgi:hypothetical protein
MPQLGDQPHSEPPLCTHQYASAFGTYRKPTPVQDTLIKTPMSSHALVISNGHAFSIPIKVDEFHAHFRQLNDSPFFLHSSSAARKT